MNYRAYLKHTHTHIQSLIGAHAFIVLFKVPQKHDRGKLLAVNLEFMYDLYRKFSIAQIYQTGFCFLNPSLIN